MGQLGELRSTGLVEEVVGVLRQAIWDGRLSAGDRLNEPRLAAEFGVSRAPIREAIRRLEADGLVDSVPRRGSFVRRLSSEDIMEIYTLECALEGLAARLIIESASPHDFDHLEALLDRIEAANHEDLGGKIERDLEFHRALVTLSGNSRLVLMWEQLVGQIRLALILVDPSLYEHEYLEATHRPLVDAMRAGDSVEATRLVDTLMNVGRGLSERWSQIGPSAETQTRRAAPR